MSERREQIAAIIDRIEVATGPDRAIDRAVMALFYDRDTRHIGTEENSGPGGRWVPVSNEVWVDPTTGKWVTTAIDGFEFTGTFNAAVNLAERVFPGHEWCVRRRSDESLGEIRLTPLETYQASEATPPLALVSAVLRSILYIERKEAERQAVEQAAAKTSNPAPTDVEIELAEYYEHLCTSGRVTGVPANVFSRLLTRLRADATRIAELEGRTSGGDA